MNKFSMTPRNARAKGALVIERRDVAAVLAELPEHCLTIDKASGEIIGIRRGELGYHPIQIAIPPSATKQDMVDGYNRARGITPAQVIAMENGSLFGWHVPAADPRLCAQILERAAEASK